MRKPRQSWSISVMIVVLFSVFMSTIVVVMSVVSYNYLYRTVEERTIAYNEVILNQAAQNVGEYISNISSLSSIIDTNREIRSYLEDPHGENAGLVRARFMNFLNYLPQIDNGIGEVFIFNADLQIVYAPSYLQMKEGYDVTQDLWYRTISSDPTSRIHLIPTSVRTMTRKSNPWVIAVARRILNERTGELLGYQLVELNYNKIANILSGLALGENGYVFIMDSAGNMIYHPQMQLINFGLKSEDIGAAMNADDTILLGDTGKLYNAAGIPGTDYSVVGVIYIQGIVTRWQQMLLLYLFLTLTMTLAAFIGSVQLAKFISRPLSRLESSAVKVAAGELSTAFDGKGTQETEHVASTLSSMLDTIRRLMDESVRNQDQIRVSEIRTLQAQINPHFLYNTLDTIVWMAEETDAAEIRELTMALATYFRVVLSSGRDLITVNEEMSHVESYLYIQKVRYQMLDYEVTCSADVGDLYMPKLLVQPIVENAIYHGIRDSGTRGRVSVDAKRSNDFLVISVADTGRGMRKRELENIWKGSRSPHPQAKGGGIALQNVLERIRLHFGDSYGVRVESEFRRGTKVTIELPIISSPEDEDE